MNERPTVPGPEDPTPADVPRGEAEVAEAEPTADAGQQNSADRSADR